MNNIFFLCLNNIFCLNNILCVFYLRLFAFICFAFVCLLSFDALLLFARHSPEIGLK